MKKRRNNKQLMTIAILLVAVVGLSIGFAAFSNILTISSSATVTPNASTFNVDFSSSASSVVANNITPTVVGATGTAATIDNTTNPTIKNLNATFTAPGQSVKYTFYAYNAGEYEAFLTNVKYLNVEGEESNKVCTPATGTTAALVTLACEDISVTVKADTITATDTQTVSGKSLAKGASHKIEVTIAYAENGARADGEFSVEFGDITLTYKSVDDSSSELITFYLAVLENGASQSLQDEYPDDLVEINGNRYFEFTAEEGMTWYKWSQSSYYGSGVSQYVYMDETGTDESLTFNDYSIYSDEDMTVNVYSTDVIISGGMYYFDSY